ncbi:MAG: hypothetical protein AAF805_06755, partial [Planctomycetota bacterium]
MELRPEYVDAVEGARFAWTFWAMIVAPPLTILAAEWSLPRTDGQSGLRRFFMPLLVAALLFWALGVMHTRQLSATKMDAAQNEAEMIDASSDLGQTLAPLTLVPIALIYSGLHCSLAALASVLGTKRRAAEFM